MNVGSKVCTSCRQGTQTMRPPARKLELHAYNDNEAAPLQLVLSFLSIVITQHWWETYCFWMALVKDVRDSSSRDLRKSVVCVHGATTLVILMVYISHSTLRPWSFSDVVAPVAELEFPTACPAWQWQSSRDFVELPEQFA
jgi:hypothetical protein